MAKISMDSMETKGLPLEASSGVDESAAAERRRERRAGVTVRIDYATVDEMFSEFTRDINAGGLFIETEKPHAPGTEVSMQFHLPGSADALQTIGRVVRVSSGDVSSPPGMGIEFDELTSEDRGKIDLIVRALRSEAS
ncbi:MAG: TIGR02266 family protein [Myxococcota bacterium]